MYPRVGEKRRIDEIGLEDEEAIGSLCRLSGRPVSPKSAMEQEKRIRREIANSNERRRMQSINAGFTSLKALLPHNEGEKLSKAAILQQTTEYIYQLEQEKTRLLSQNCQLKRLLNQHQHHAETEGSPAGGDSPSEDRCSNSPLLMPGGTTELDSLMPEDNKREIVELRVQLERERRHRISLEEHVRNIEAQTSQVKSVVKVEYEDFEEKPIKTVKEISEEPKVTRVTPANNVISNNTVTIAKSDSHSHKANHYVSQVTTTNNKLNNKSSGTSSQPANVTVSRSVHPHHVTQSPTTIVTVVPSPKDSNDAALPSVLEALTNNGRCGQTSGVKVEVEPALRVPSPATTIECVDDSTPGLNRTVYIVNSNNAACQKSLDTICEAIRHLEGDHMFPVEEQHSPIEEEIITDETFVTVEDHSFHQQSVGHSGGLGQLTLQMVPSEQMVPEPQEVPLELTTTHRVDHSTSKECTTISHAPVSSSTILQQVSRPGVIVVKQT